MTYQIAAVAMTLSFVVSWIYMYLYVTDCVSRSRHRVVRFHCLARGSATLDVHSTRPAMLRHPSTVRHPPLTALPGADSVDRLGLWEDHAAGLWTAPDHDLARLIEASNNDFSFCLQYNMPYSMLMLILGYMHDVCLFVCNFGGL